MSSCSKFILLLVTTLFLSGCAAVPKELAARDRGVPRKIAIFMDGTANDETADTNVKKLHSLVSLQDRNDVSTFYIEGVGAHGKAVGMATGWGIGERVRKAYNFLLREYRAGDEIYIFGFSRGAYSARILASMLQNVGLPDFRSDPAGQLQYEVLSDLVYETTFRDGRPEEMRQRVDDFLARSGIPAERRGSVPVKVLGLFDTVEALGWFPRDEDVGDRNTKYGDQLCNVEHAYHAMSIDDDRATFFTPKLLTRAHVFRHCMDRLPKLDTIVDEVWFSGAHSDVGGGYLDSLLSGVPLNWMIRKLQPTGLLPTSAAVRENYLDLGHDPEDLHLLGMYPRQYRDLRRYIEEEEALPGRRLKVHRSVIERLEKCGKVCDEKAREQMKAALQWDVKWIPGCFLPLAPGYRYAGAQGTVCRIQIAEPEWKPQGK